MSASTSLLLPTHSFGYYLQLAALALGGVGPPSSAVGLHSAAKYKSFVMKVLDAIADIKAGVKLSSYGAADIISSLCNALDEPKYMYNPTVDSDFPRSVFNLASKAGMTLTGVGNKSICHMVAVYANLLLSNVALQGSVKLPMLMRATVFGKTRGPSLAGLAQVQLNSVGLALLGALAAYLGSVNVSGSEYEYFVVPDGSVTSLKNYRVALEVLGGVIGRRRPTVPEVWGTFSNVGGVALDLATYLAVLVRLTESGDTIGKALALAKDRVFESLMLVRLEAGGRRPQLAWAGSLVVSEPLVYIAERELDKAFQDVYKLARKGVELAEKGVKSGEKLLSAASSCANSLAIASLATTSDEVRSSLLLDCARSLSSLLDEEDLSGDERNLVSRTLRDLV